MILRYITQILYYYCININALFGNCFVYYKLKITERTVMLTMRGSKTWILTVLSLAISATITVGAANIDDGEFEIFDGEAKFYIGNNEYYDCGKKGEKISFPGAVDGREYYYSDGTATVSLGYDWFTDEDMTVPITASDKVYGKGMSKFYGKEYSLDNNNGQVSFCGFDNLITETENGVLDEENRYYVSKALKKGFVNSGFKIFNTGAFTGSRYIKYTSPSKDEKNSIVDISNGVALKPYVTYKLMLYYKSTGNAELKFEGVTDFNDNENNEQPLSSKEVAKTDDWTKAELYYTSGSSESIPVIRVKAETGVEVRIDTVSIYEAVYSDYSAVSDVDDNAKKLTLGFSYGSVNGSESTVGLSTYQVKERGIIAAAEDAYGKDFYDMLTIENAADINSKLIWAKKSSGLEDSLLQQDGKYTYSISISGFANEDEKKILARGYLILNDGTDTIWYSDIISTSVKDVLDEAKRVSEEQKRLKTYELNANNNLSKLNLQGRDYLRNGYPNLDWTASEIEFWATASGNVEVSMDVNIKARSQIYFTVYVDNVCRPRMGIYHSSVPNAPNVVENGKATLNIDLGKDYKEHHIRIIRQTEAYSATITVKSLTMFGELEERKTTDRPLIEFIGDSITCGLGDMTLKTDTTYYDPGYPNDKKMNYGDGNQDGTIAYPFLTAENIGYDRRVLSRSGMAVYYPNSSSKDINSLLLSWTNAYNYANVFDSSNQTNEYSPERQADIVCINLGTNDMNGNQLYGYVPDNTNDLSIFSPEFAKKIAAFLKIIKAKNPNAKIVWVVGAMRNDYLTAVELAFKELGGEENGYYCCKVSSGLKDGGGDHPSKASHTLLANELTDYLKKIF